MAKRDIRYFLHNEFGVKVDEVTLPSYNYSAIIIEHDKVCYRPLHYDLFTRTAICVPVKKITVEGKHESSRTERQSTFVTATKE